MSTLTALEIQKIRTMVRSQMVSTINAISFKRAIESNDKEFLISEGFLIRRGLATKPESFEKNAEKLGFIGLADLFEIATAPPA